MSNLRIRTMQRCIAWHEARMSEIFATLLAGHNQPDRLATDLANHSAEIASLKTEIALELA